MPRPSKYPEPLRRDAVELVRSSGRALRDVGHEPGVSYETLRNWVNAAKQAEQRMADGCERSGEVSPDERRSCAGCGRRSPFWELEKEILRKPAAYFVKEMGR